LFNNYFIIYSLYLISISTSIILSSFIIAMHYLFSLISLISISNYLFYLSFIILMITPLLSFIYLQSRHSLLNSSTDLIIIIINILVSLITFVIFTSIFYNLFTYISNPLTYLYLLLFTFIISKTYLFIN